MGARLKESAACLVLAEQDLGFQMRELLKATGHDAPDTVPSLELNSDHPLVGRLLSEPDGQRFENLSWALFEQATLVEGQPLEDPASFVRRMNELILDDGSAADDSA